MSTSRLAPLPHRLCSHLQNVSRGAIARTTLPYTVPNLAISNILLRHGLISSMTLGDPTQPDPSNFPSTPINAKRIWVDMKYRNGLPVLRHMNLISKPSFRVFVTRDELGRILHGKRARNVGGIGMGEILVVKTDQDQSRGISGISTYMDGWEAWRAGLGGELLLRAS